MNITEKFLLLHSQAVMIFFVFLEHPLTPRPPPEGGALAAVGGTLKWKSFLNLQLFKNPELTYHMIFDGIGLPPPSSPPWGAPLQGLGVP